MWEWVGVYAYSHSIPIALVTTHVTPSKNGIGVLSSITLTAYSIFEDMSTVTRG